MSNPTELPDLDAQLEAALGDMAHAWSHAETEAAKKRIRRLFARRAQPEGEAPQAEPAELTGVREQIEKGAGFWHACSGCHDTEDGHPTGPYAYSSTMGCALGNGCSECGGIGAIWDNNDYESMAQDWDALDDAPAAQHAESGAQAVTGWEQRLNAVAPALRVKTKEQAMEAEIAAWRALAAQSQGAQAPVPREFSTAIEDLHTVVNVIAERLDGDGRTAMARRLQNAAVDVDLTARAALAAKAEAPTVVFANDGREPDWQGYAEAERAQQAAAPGALDLSERDILDAAENAGLWPNTIHHWIPALQRYTRNILERYAPSAPGTPEAPQTAAARDVLAERQRQVEAEGWAPAHDDQHDDRELAMAAAGYIMAGKLETAPRPRHWPWPIEWWKPRGLRRNLVRAGALVLAEIERLDRVAQLDGSQGEGEGA